MTKHYYDTLSILERLINNNSIVICINKLNYVFYLK